MLEKRNNEKKNGYTVYDMRWIKLQSFVAGFVFACIALAGLVNFLLSIKGLFK